MRLESSEIYLRPVPNFARSRAPQAGKCPLAKVQLTRFHIMLPGLPCLLCPRPSPPPPPPLFPPFPLWLSHLPASFILPYVTLPFLGLIALPHLFFLPLIALPHSFFLPHSFCPMLHCSTSLALSYLAHTALSHIIPPSLH